MGRPASPTTLHRRDPRRVTHALTRRTRERSNAGVLRRATNFRLPRENGAFGTAGSPAARGQSLDGGGRRGGVRRGAGRFESGMRRRNGGRRRMRRADTLGGALSGGARRGKGREAGDTESAGEPPRREQAHARGGLHLHATDKNVTCLIPERQARPCSRTAVERAQL
eukprot:366278-Chlamydomonas_euryale.AAC.26